MRNKLVEKKLLPSEQEEMEKRKKEDLDYQFEAHLRELRACNNIESQINEQYESIKKAQLKANTPTIYEKGLILEKTNKNYIEENKQLLTNGARQYASVAIKVLLAWMLLTANGFIDAIPMLKHGMIRTDQAMERILIRIRNIQTMITIHTDGTTIQKE